MVKDDIVQEALLGVKIGNNFAVSPMRFSCYLCYKKVEPIYVEICGERKVCFAQRDSRPICFKCHEKVGKIDRFVTKMFQLFNRRNLWKIKQSV